MNSYLEDQDGNKSSKRLWGSILMFTGTFLSASLALLAVFHPISTENANLIVKIIEINFIGGFGALGVTEIGKLKQLSKRK